MTTELSAPSIGYCSCTDFVPFIPWRSPGLVSLLPAWITCVWGAYERSERLDPTFECRRSYRVYRTVSPILYSTMFYGLAEGELGRPAPDHSPSLLGCEPTVELAATSVLEGVWKGGVVA